MASPRTTTSYAILGLLAVRPWTTYELAKQVRRSLNWFWPRAERKLYDEPRRLVADGLATASEGFTGRRKRTTYAITDGGRSELARWLGEPPAPRTHEFEGMVRVFFADSGDLDQLRATLDRIEAEADERLAALAEMAVEPGQYPERLHLSALCLQLQLEQEAAVRRWTRWAREQVATWDSTTDPGDWDTRAVLDSLGARAVVEP
jgi:PadR family transcriptional regulator, regulatory protein AphA